AILLRGTEEFLPSFGFHFRVAGQGCFRIMQGAPQKHRSAVEEELLSLDFEIAHTKLYLLFCAESLAEECRLKPVQGRFELVPGEHAFSEGEFQIQFGAV